MSAEERVGLQPLILHQCSCRFYGKILGIFGVVFGVPNPKKGRHKDNRQTERQTGHIAGQALGLSTATPQHV